MQNLNTYSDMNSTTSAAGPWKATRPSAINSNLSSHINHWSAGLKMKFLTHLKLCLATATHNFKWVKNTHTRTI